MESLYLLLGIAISVWLLTSAKTRKSWGSSSQQASQNLHDSLYIQSEKQIVEYELESLDNGIDSAKRDEMINAFRNRNK